MTAFGRLQGWLVRNLRDWNSPLGTMAVRVVGMAVNFGILALAAHWAGQESLGVVIAINGAAFLGGIICSLGVPTLLLKSMTGHLLAQDLALASAEYHRGMIMVVKFSCAGIAGLVAIAVLQRAGLIPILGSLGPRELFALGLCSLALAVQNVGLSALRALKRPALSGLFQFCTQPLCLVAGLLVAWKLPSGFTTQSTVWAVTGGIVLNAGMVLLQVRLILGATQSVSAPPLSLPEVRSLWLLAILSNAAGQAPLLLSALLLVPIQVPLLGVPFRISNLPMTVVIALGTYYAPILREAFIQGDVTKQRRQLRESQWLGGLLVLPVLLAAVFVPGPTLRLFGQQESSARQLLLLFAAAQLLIAGCGISEQYLAMIGRPKLANFYTLACLICTVVVGTLMHHVYGVVGLGATWAFFGVVRQSLLLFVCHGEMQRGDAVASRDPDHAVIKVAKKS